MSWRDREQGKHSEQAPPPGCNPPSQSIGAQTNTIEDVERWSRHLLHISQHNQTPIFLAGRMQDLANEMRKSVGVSEFGWNDWVPDAEFKECSVHASGCQGQETHRSV